MALTFGSLTLRDLAPGDLLRYIENPRIPKGFKSSVLVYISPHDARSSRSWEMGVFLSNGGTVHYERVLYLRRA